MTVEEGCLAGGYGSAVLESAIDAGWDVRRLRRLGLPDRFIEHGERQELLADVGLDAEGIVQACLALTDAADMLGVQSGRGFGKQRSNRLVSCRNMQLGTDSQLWAADWPYTCALAA